MMSSCPPHIQIYGGGGGWINVTNILPDRVLSVVLWFCSPRLNLLSVAHPEGDFQVLPAPDVHAGVVLAELVKILPVHSKQTACHGGRPGGGGLETADHSTNLHLKTSVGPLPDWSGGSLRPTELRGGDGVPLEVKPPVEAAPDDGGGRVCERVRGDDVDDGADDGAAVRLDGSQQRLQPRLVHLTVTVQEDQHLTWTQTGETGLLRLCCQGGKVTLKDAMSHM